MRKYGWEVDAEGRDAKCPDCLGRNRANGSDKEAEPVKPSTMAVKAYLAANRLITEHYIPADKRYARGFSDAVIATQTGLPEVAIAEIREEDHGPLMLDESVLKFGRDLQLFAQNMNDEIAQMQEMLDDLNKRLSEKVAQMKLRQDDFIKGKAQR